VRSSPAEHSGHYYFRDNFRADSGLIAALVLLEAVADARGPLSALVAPLRQVRQLRRDQHDGRRHPAATDRSPQTFADGRARLGRRAHRGVRQRWFNLRPSNTEPLLRLNVEADTPERMAEIRDRVQGIITAV
jgi:phosphomannomutase